MGPLESGYEQNRNRQGLEKSSLPMRGVVWGLTISLGGTAIVAGFIYWIGSMQFWR